MAVLCCQLLVGHGMRTDATARHPWVRYYATRIPPTVTVDYCRPSPWFCLLTSLYSDMAASSRASRACCRHPWVGSRILLHGLQRMTNLSLIARGLISNRGHHNFRMQQRYMYDFSDIILRDHYSEKTQLADSMDAEVRGYSWQFLRMASMPTFSHSREVILVPGDRTILSTQY